MSIRSPRTAPDLAGRLLGRRYRVGARLAADATGSAHAAVDLRLGRAVIVTVIHPEHARSGAQRRRIRDAATRAAEVDHPHVLPVLDVGEGISGDGARFVFWVTPRLPGRRLREIVAQGPIAWPRAVGLVEQQLAGLGALHRAGVGCGGGVAEACVVGVVDGREHLRLAAGGVAGVEAAVRGDLVAVGEVLRGLLLGPGRGAARGRARGVPRTLAGVVRRGGEGEGFASAEAFRRALLEAAAEVGAGCGTRHAGCDAALESLAAWTRLEYRVAKAEAERAMRLGGGWGPLWVIMSGVPEA